MERRTQKQMKKTDKPRVCEVLGVEVGERFGVRGDNRWWYLTPDQQHPGKMDFASDGWWHNQSDEIRLLRTIIDSPGRIIRKPRFTGEEMADAKVLARALLADGFERDKSGDVFATSSVACRTLLDSHMFPSLRPGQAVKLEEVTYLLNPNDVMTCPGGWAVLAIRKEEEYDSRQPL